MKSKNTPAERRALLAEELERKEIDFALVSHPKHVFYLTGFTTNLNPWQSIMKGPRPTSLLALWAEGSASLLVGASEFAGCFPGGKADAAGVFKGDISLYTDYDLSTTMVAYGNVLAREMKKWLEGFGSKSGRIGVEEWNMPELLGKTLLKVHPDAELYGISELMLSMRSSKGADEIKNIVEATGRVGYALGLARKGATVGRTELDVYADINAGSFRKYGPFGWVVGDHASGERSLTTGGPPTSRKLVAGDTMILDLQTSNNNYWADLCRTFAVGRRPSRQQEKALSVLKEAKAAAEELLLPGTKGKEVYDAVSRVMVESGYSKLSHHAGHSIGLDDQEPPWFIPAEERRLQAGSVCVLEPGVYRKDCGGIRIEDLYVVRKNGPERISTFPLDL